MSILKVFQRFVNFRDRTASERSENLRMFHYISGLTAEVGEIAAIHQKTIRAGKSLSDIDLDHLEEELGDLLWYITVISNFYNLELEQIIKLNITKLENKFNTEEFKEYHVTR